MEEHSKNAKMTTNESNLSMISFGMADLLFDVLNGVFGMFFLFFGKPKLN